jgi:carbon-monoxide dehydrogenase small subunit
MLVKLRVNGEEYELEVQPAESLNLILREHLGLTGTKKGCDSGGCGACTVLLNGRPVYSCMTYGPKADGGDVLTIEGLSKDGELDAIQRSFAELYAFQCGFCTPGFIMSTRALLDRNPSPSDLEIEEALVGNLCRCTGYTKIMEAVRNVSKSEG